MVPPSTRRTFLRRCGVGLAIGLAGCLGSDRSGSSQGSPTGESPNTQQPSTDTGTATTGSTPTTDTDPTTGTDSTSDSDADPSSPDGEPPVLWHADLGSPVAAPPAVSDGS